jgi:hypothetical protein
VLTPRRERAAEPATGLRLSPTIYAGVPFRSTGDPCCISRILRLRSGDAARLTRRTPADERDAILRDRRSGDRHPHSVLRNGASDADQRT